MTKLLSYSEIKQLDNKTIENKNITSLDLMSHFSYHTVAVNAIMGMF